MVDYIFEVPLTKEGVNAITDPDALSFIISEGSYMISGVTYNELNVDTVNYDAETKKVYYGINASPAMKAGLVSLNATERLAWKHVLMAGVGIAGAVLCVGLSPFVATGIIIVTGVAIAIDYFTGKQEVQMSQQDTKQLIIEKQSEVCNPLFHDPNLANKYYDGVDEGWKAEIMEAVKWIILLVGGAVALQIILPIITRIGKREG